LKKKFFLVVTDVKKKLKSGTTNRRGRFSTVDLRIKNIYIYYLQYKNELIQNSQFKEVNRTEPSN